MTPQDKGPRMPNAVMALKHGQETARQEVAYWQGVRANRLRMVASQQERVDDAQDKINVYQRKVQEFEAAIALVEGR